MCLGLTPDRSYAGCSISGVSRACPHLVRLITGWVAASLADDDFKFGSIQVNYNYIARKHIDMNNLGPSYITSLGEHTGGELWTGDRGVLDCHDVWKMFDGNTEHCTQPFEGERYSFILFTPDAYNRLTAAICAEARSLGMSAASTDGTDDAYFARFRDLGAVDERRFDAYIAARAADAPPPAGRGALAVECNGYAAGRGSGWVSWQARGAGAAGVEKVSFPKNKTGIHVVALDLDPGGGGTFARRATERFGLYEKTEKESARWARWVERLPAGRVVAICITDTAMAKTRPLGPEVYAALRKLGAPAALSLIGYREPFAFLGYKGAAEGNAVYALDQKKQSKQLVRVEATACLAAAATAADAGGGGVAFSETRNSEVKLLQSLENPAAGGAVALQQPKEAPERPAKKGKQSNGR